MERERPKWTPVTRRVAGFRNRDNRLRSRFQKIGERRVWLIPLLGANDRPHSQRLKPALTSVSRSGPMGRGELYEYYKRQGLLDVFFALYPGG